VPALLLCLGLCRVLLVNAGAGLGVLSLIFLDTFSTNIFEAMEFIQKYASRNARTPSAANGYNSDQ
jgi:hypothetical protein